MFPALVHIRAKIFFLKGVALFTLRFDEEGPPKKQKLTRAKSLLDTLSFRSEGLLLAVVGASAVPHLFCRLSFSALLLVLVSG